MCFKTLANYIKVTNTRMATSESYRLCCHNSKPLVVSGVPAAVLLHALSTETVVGAKVVATGLP
jgi:uncharacterized sodium:solute symporter family permease YidK